MIKFIHENALKRGVGWVKSIRYHILYSNNKIINTNITMRLNVCKVLYARIIRKSAQVFIIAQYTVT